MRFTTLTLMVLLAGCGGKHTGSYTKSAGEAEATGASATLAAADELWEQRVDLEKLKAALEKYQEALGEDPNNRHALERLTRGYYFWGDAFVDDKDQKVEIWGKAIEQGAHCLALNDKISSAIAAGEKEKDAVAHATKDDVPCLYWTASALGKWGKIQSLSKTLKHLPTVKAYISKVEELEPQFFYTAPARYWGAYYAALPSFAGQDATKSGEYFAASIEGSPTYLGTRVLRAEYYAVLTEDVSLFDADLKFVLDADINADPAIMPENTREQEKAKKLMAERSELFSSKSIEAAGSGGGE